MLPLSLSSSLIEYDNTIVKMVALRKIPNIETPGLVLDEVDERNEFSVPFWVANLLVETGLAKYGEEGLTTEEWTSTHFKERFNPGGPPGAIPKDFYARAYISLTIASKVAENEPVKTEQLNRLHARFREIIESRVSKVTRIATAETSPQSGILQVEEQELYQALEHVITNWRRDLRRLGTK